MGSPEKKFKVGACTASIFVNEANTKDGKVPIKTVVLQRVYKDKSGKFQNVTSFGTNDVPKAVLALEKAYDHMVSKDIGE